MNSLQKATLTLIALFSIAFLDGFFEIGFSSEFYLTSGIVQIVALWFVWRAAYPKR